VDIPGNFTAQRYCDEILQPHVLPLMQQNGARFQHDNARPYTARITTALLTNSNVAVLPWTSKSPDLNPIEHLWDALAKDNHTIFESLTDTLNFRTISYFLTNLINDPSSLKRWALDPMAASQTRHFSPYLI
jgi:transposase